ncbi:MAG: ATP-binding protein [Thermoplasmata archaeon]|nr:ATP-binding protein [Thermoplasmata archaeon]
MMKGKVTLPYPINQNFTESLREKDDEFTINWNGLTVTVAPKKNTAKNQERAREIATALNQIPEEIKNIDIAPHRRGFFKPNYSPSKVSQNPVSDEEVATLLINDPHLAPRISVVLEKIANRDFRIYIPPGTATAYFLSTDKSSKTSVDLVNEGFGVNQIVYLLTKLHRPETKTVLIEEPEVHLHPSIIRSFVKELCSIIKDEGKQVILTTYSEVLVTSLLAAVRRKDISSTDVKCYLVKKEKKESVFEEQRVNPTGQIAGGLGSFMEGEIEEVKEDDAYLLLIQKKTGGKIITTDNKLVKAIRSKRIPCELRDEFLKRYL